MIINQLIPGFYKKQNISSLFFEFGELICFEFRCYFCCLFLDNTLGMTGIDRKENWFVSMPEHDCSLR
jgi:hypothetical protein